MPKSDDAVLLKPVTGRGRVTAAVEPYYDQILDMYIDGWSFRAIVEHLKIPLTAAQARMAIAREIPERYAEAVSMRAHELIERNGEHAVLAARTGEAPGLKAASEINFKLAGLYDPTRFGEKRTVELTGAGGGSIKTESTVTLTPDEAYQLLLKGAR